MASEGPAKVPAAQRGWEAKPWLPALQTTEVKGLAGEEDEAAGSE